jgi:predicted dehydrogenase
MSAETFPTRRKFLKQSAAGAGLLILPSGVLSGKNKPNSKLNIGLIGTGGRATAHFDALQNENVVVLCDVDENHMAKAAARFTGATPYVDWRKCLEHKNLDAIVCATTDHTHALIANWAMLRGIHVYCEKPLATTVKEARTVRATYLANAAKLATQVGTQLHAGNGYQKVRDLIRTGAVGELLEVCAWGDRKIPKDGYFPAKGEPPKHLHYDLWLGPSAFHSYHPAYFDHVVPGSNCLNWNMFWDFGCGQVGDMGSHSMDLVWNAIDAVPPTSVVAEGDPFHPDVSPVKLVAHFQIPANAWRKAIKLSWFQGGAMPDEPVSGVLRGIGHGAIFTGTDAWLISDYHGTHVIVPKTAKDGERFSRTAVKGGYSHQGEWIEACKGGPKPSCDFDYAGRMIETMLLSLVAYRAGEKIEYDASTGTVKGNAKANALLSKSYREPWSLVG